MAGQNPGNRSRRRHRARADRSPRSERTSFWIARGIRRDHRGSRLAQHVAEREGRTHRGNARRCARMFPGHGYRLSRPARHVDREESFSQNLLSVQERVFGNVLGWGERLGGRDGGLTANCPPMSARHDAMTMAKRIFVDQCWGLFIDAKNFFLAQTDKRLRSNIETNTKNFARLLGY